MLPLVSALFALQLAPVSAPTSAPTQLSEPVVFELELPGLESHARDHRQVQPDGRVARWGTDMQGGVRSAAWIEQQRRADFARVERHEQRLAPTLQSHLETLGSEDTVEVAFWLHDEFSSSTPARLIGERAYGLTGSAVPVAVRATRLELFEASRVAHAGRQQAFEQRLLAAGASVVTRGGAWPVTIARVPSARVIDLAGSPEVDRAYRSMQVWEAEGNHAQNTLRTKIATQQGATAEGSVVRFLVNDTSEVVPDSPYLPPVNYLLGPGSNSYHATAVAGNVANNHPVYAAASAGLPEIWSAGETGDSNAPIVWEAAILNGIDFGNCSWWNFLKGDIEFLDRFFDYTIRNFGVMMFKSNGNQGNSATPYGTTPGQGYNMLSTGNYSDKNNSTWTDDSMESDSSYWNPITGHAKPEVASPGAEVNTTSTQGGIYQGFGGTSSASPLTAGVATLLASSRPELLGQMTTVKALLMASAWHNIVGGPLLSDRDGAGGVHTAAAWATLRDNQFDFRNVTDADFPGDLLEVPIDLRAGDETRVIALWFSNPDSAYSTDVLEMDLDMTVLDPAGTVVATSISAVNPFELASFIPAVTGTYTVALTKQRFDGAAEPLSIVWSSRSDAATAVLEVHPDPSVPVGSPVELMLTDPFESGSPFVLDPAAYVITLAGPNGSDFALPGGYTLPSGLDSITAALLGLPGAVGLLDIDNKAKFAFQVPNSPGLIGLTFRASALVFEGAAVSLEAIQTTSRVLELTITN